jgi:hypothetical protein
VLRSLLQDESRELQAQTAYLQHAAAAELDGAAARARERMGWLEGQVAALSDERSAYNDGLHIELTKYLKSEVEIRDAHVRRERLQRRSCRRHRADAFTMPAASERACFARPARRRWSHYSANRTPLTPSWERSMPSATSVQPRGSTLSPPCCRP